MIKPSCPKCGHAEFEMTEIIPKNSQFKMTAIHCSKCGSIVGTHAYENTGILIRLLAKKLKVSLDG